MILLTTFYKLYVTFLYVYKGFSFIVSLVCHECHFDIDRYVYYASYKIYYLLPLLVEKAGWIEFPVLFLLH